MLDLLWATTYHLFLSRSDFAESILLFRKFSLSCCRQNCKFQRNFLYWQIDLVHSLTVAKIVEIGLVLLNYQFRARLSRAVVMILFHFSISWLLLSNTRLLLRLIDLFDNRQLKTYSPHFANFFFLLQLLCFLLSFQSCDLVNFATLTADLGPEIMLLIIFS